MSSVVPVPGEPLVVEGRRPGPSAGRVAVLLFVDLVIRGEDLLSSTGRQIRIARLLGREEPATFLHHPLIMKSPAQKLSKSDGDTGIRELRARGWTPEQVKQAARSAIV